LVTELTSGAGEGESAPWAENLKKPPPLNASKQAKERTTVESILCFIISNKTRIRTTDTKRRIHGKREGAV
jgi:hypothetical protein